MPHINIPQIVDRILERFPDYLELEDNFELDTINGEIDALLVEEFGINDPQDGELNDAIGLEIDRRVREEVL